MPYRREVLVQVWKITEWRDGAVYKTELQGTRWVPLEERRYRLGEDLLSAPMSTSYEGPTMRSVKITDEEQS